MTQRTDWIVEGAMQAKLQRLYRLVATLAHPNDDHCENTFEDEAHDLIREIRGHVLEADAARQRAEEALRGRRACDCSEPDPVMQADGKFYCYRCSFQTGARPHLDLEDALRRVKAAEEARDTLLQTIVCKNVEEAVQGIRGLQARIRFTETFETVQYKLREAEEAREELEARLCPEDFGFEEYISHLKKQLGKAEARAVQAEEERSRYLALAMDLREELKAAEEARAQLERERDEMKLEMFEREDYQRRKTLQAEARVAQLEPYVQHKPSCGVLGEYEVPCDCGLEVLKTVEKPT